ncbi:MAG: hypothetical protein KJO38_04455, partial [Gammaproteobacteria bacterium]|nr:hypothetical protein [Gammaproteobacteria bacterium]
ALGDDAAYLLRAWQIGDRNQLLAQQLYRPESRGGAAATITRYDLGGSAIDLRSSEDGMQLPRAIASVLARMPGCVLRLTRHDNHVRARPEQPCTDIALPPTLRERDGFESGPDLLTLPLPAADRPLAARRVRLISG